ncbi:RNA-metabolising metallo-beta-lactamase [Syntrophomonas zehnderi OL-4]|uniref:RNA-metabolising metallo-beta-lactamase n=1 Tax=Syntrophomonas zehnderi OL-4 TaxID=690567 RepID=A0A0E3W3B4_9FIRM|nr:MBL fold metallo-hydrolase [Syntrophomonas zehnderi]CFX69494.1 RNA-metabolising metallo-beta-lactamase [Syntrophomonas zehnderi OL-4]
MKIKFLGAARTVTGSFHVIETDQVRFAIDCGLFQGSKEVRERNYQDFKIDPRSLQFLILTHAHIDHSGLIPKLYNSGFRGQIFCNTATAELCEVMLPDSAYIQESEVKRKNRKLSRAGQKLLNPIYTVEDATNCLALFRPINYDEIIELAPGVKARFRDAGHILGSSIVELWLKEGSQEIKIVFSGDLGNFDRAFVKDPTTIESADYVIMESTYGDRFHKEVFNRQEKLKQIIDDTMKKGGNLIIPAFAVERTQDLIYDFNELYLKGDLDPDIDIYIDSPLAIAATEIFKNHTSLYDAQTMQHVKNGNHPLYLPNLKYSRTQEESVQLNKIEGGTIIISASGMCEAGRIKHHLKHNLWRPEATILIVGFQAQGTLGRRIVDGEKTVVIHGEQVSVKADICNMDLYSGHADQAGLFAWLKKFNSPPSKVFLVHGDEQPQKTLGALIEQELKMSVEIPRWLEEYELTASAPEIVTAAALEETSNDALKAEELYLQVRTKLNELFQAGSRTQDYAQIIEKLNQIKANL